MTEAAVATAATVAPAAATAAKPRILCVDDEPNVVDALAMNLRRKFDVVTANSGAAGLERLAADPSIAVVISDMQMPGMSGAEWLAKACASGHDAVRILLTGHADVKSAIAAVNEGRIFRFLTKPCPRADLEAVIGAALEQHRLVTAERVLLEQTLHGSIQMLVDVLALTNPALFGRASRIKAQASALAKALGLEAAWQIEVAAMLSQIGQVVLPDALCEKLLAGHKLTDDERKMADRAPEIAEQLLAHIPRLDGVRAILGGQKKLPRVDRTAPPARRAAELGAHVLYAAALLDELEAAGESDPIAVLGGKPGIDPDVVAAAAAQRATRAPKFVVKEIAAGALRVGMVLAEDVRMVAGPLLVARGYEITPQFVERLRNFSPGVVREPFRILVAA